MSVFNRRNALFGWVAWTAAKEVGKRSARKKLHAEGGGRRRAIPPAVAAATAASIGLLLFWRRRKPAGHDEDAQ
jgi:hypothetical protein